MNKTTKRTLLVIVAAIVVGGIVGALVYFFGNRPHRISWEADRFTDEKTGIEYTMCNPLAVKAIALDTDGDGDYIAYAEDRNMTYYRIRFEEPTEFLCDWDKESGTGYVYRNSGLPDITIENFEPISAAMYKNSVLTLWLFADDEYLPEEERGQNPSQDTALVKQIADALVTGEAVEIANDDISDDAIYHFRLFSQKYPGLYYDVALFETKDGTRYLEDMATFKKVLCPADVEATVLA